MRTSQILQLIACTFVVASCGGTSGSDSNTTRGSTVIGDYKVGWFPVTGKTIPVPATSWPSESNPTHLAFSFTFADNSSLKNPGVTEADWEREAKLIGATVAHVKEISFSGSRVYKQSNGRLAPCTFWAIDRGLCGKKMNLSVSQRVALAQKALATSPKCRWVKFDPSFNSIYSNALGAASYSLHVRADCG